MMRMRGGFLTSNHVAVTFISNFTLLTLGQFVLCIAVCNKLMVLKNAFPFSQVLSSIVLTKMATRLSI